MTETTETGATASFRERWGAVNRLTRDVRPRVAMVALAAFATGLIEAAFLVAVARIGLIIAEGGSDVTLTRGVTIPLGLALVIAALVLIVRLLMSLLSVRVQAGVVYRVTTALRTRLAHAYLRSDWSTQQSQPAGTLQQLVVTFPNQASGLVGALAGAGGAALSLLAMLAVATMVDASTTVVIVAALVLLSFILRPFRLRIEQRSKVAVEHQVRFADNVAQLSALGLEIQTFGVQREVEEVIDDVIHNYADADRRVSLQTLAVSPVYVTAAYGAVLVALAVIARFSAAELASVGAVMLIMLRALGYGQHLQSGAAALSEVLPFLQRLENETHLLSAGIQTLGDRSVEALGRIEVRNLCFAYPDGQPVFTDLSFTIEPGEVVGIAGPSGAGKTTLVQLLLGIRRANSGEILFSGVPIDSIDEQCLRSRTAFVPQHPALISGTLRENITFFRDRLSEDAVIQAIEAVHLTPLVRDLPQGLDSDLGSSGHRLSGGQRQRLTIARALVTRPELIVLDEPTSALDAEAEAVIREAINELAGTHTVIVVAHRKATIQACDYVLTIGS